MATISQSCSGHLYTIESKKISSHTFNIWTKPATYSGTPVKCGKFHMHRTLVYLNATPWYSQSETIVLQDTAYSAHLAALVRARITAVNHVSPLYVYLRTKDLKKKVPPQALHFSISLRYSLAYTPCAIIRSITTRSHTQWSTYSVKTLPGQTNEKRSSVFHEKYVQSCPFVSRENFVETTHAISAEKSSFPYVELSDVL